MRSLAILLLVSLAFHPAFFVRASGEAPPQAPGQSLFSWGTNGTETGQVKYPWEIAIAPCGNVLVGNSLDQIEVYTQTGQFLRRWGSTGSGDGQFNKIKAIAVNHTGAIYVADRYNNRIQVFGPDGTFLFKFGTPRNEGGRFDTPNAVAIDATGRVLVSQAGLPVIQVYTPGGQFISEFGSAGDSLGQFRGIRDLAVNSTGHIYLADEGSRNRVQVFAPGGTPLFQWGETSAGGPWGYGPGTFMGLNSIAVNASGHVYVADTVRVQVFTPGGAHLHTFGGRGGAAAGQFSYITDVALNASGHLFVLERGNFRVQVFAPGVPPPADVTGVYAGLAFGGAGVVVVAAIARKKMRGKQRATAPATPEAPPA